MARQFYCALVFALGVCHYGLAAEVKEYRCSGRANEGGDFGNITVVLVLDGSNKSMSVISTDYDDRLTNLVVEHTALGVQATGISTIENPYGVSFFSLLVPRLHLGDANADEVSFRGLMIFNSSKQPPAVPSEFKLLDYQKIKPLMCTVKI